MNVMYAAKRILQNYQTLDVLYLNNSTINIDHINWDVMRDAFLTFRLPYFCSTGRISENGKNFVTVKGSGTTDLGFSRDFCVQVLSPFILVMELKDLLKEAELPGRVVWTGSTTCNRADFSFFDPQHVESENSFYGLKYFVHLLQPALNEYLHHTGVQSFEGCPGVIITGSTPAVLRRFTWLITIFGWVERGAWDVDSSFRPSRCRRIKGRGRCCIWEHIDSSIATWSRITCTPSIEVCWDCVGASM